MKNFKIVGIYRGKRETLDTTKSERNAYFLASEYKMAYGRDWTILLVCNGEILQTL